MLRLIINMQWHTHTSKIIPDASVMDHKTPQGAFRSTLLRAGATSRINHCVAGGMRGKRAAAKRWKRLVFLMRLARREHDCAWWCLHGPRRQMVLFFPRGQKEGYTSEDLRANWAFWLVPLQTVRLVVLLLLEFNPMMGFCSLDGRTSVDLENRPCRRFDATTSCDSLSSLHKSASL